MATLAPINPPTRQPLGAISGARLRNLGHVKNKQNALPTSQPSKLKTFSPQPQTFNDIDSENIDPSIFKSSNSKTSSYPSKNPSITNNMNFFKPAQYVLSRATTTAARTTTPSVRPLAQAIGTKRKAESVPSAPDAEIERPLKSARKSTPPPPAGRSPKSKRVGILSRHRTSASPFTRVDPPTFGNKKGHAVPFSIDAALAGTVSAKLRNPARTKELVAETVLESMPKGWMFPIYTDGKDEEASNLMEHSACTLDISDDENSPSKMPDEENKENIPPHPGMNAPVSNAIAAMYASRKYMMTDDPRAPLGELEASDYYAPGCDANSFITISAEEDFKGNMKDNVVPEASTAYASAKVNAGVIDDNLTWNDLVETSKPTDNSTGLTPFMSAMCTNTKKTMAASAPVLEQGSLLSIPEEKSAGVEDTL